MKYFSYSHDEHIQRAQEWRAQLHKHSEHAGIETNGVCLRVYCSLGLRQTVLRMDEYVQVLFKLCLRVEYTLFQLHFSRSHSGAVMWNYRRDKLLKRSSTTLANDVRVEAWH